MASTSGGEEDIGESTVPQESTSGGGGGGEETTGETPMLPDDAAWAEFYDWCLTQDWGPAASIPTDQQFANMAAKLHELGLPLINPATAALSP